VAAPDGVVNLAEKLTTFAERWSPRIVAQLNDLHVKVAKIDGEFVWHNHPDTDELFLVVRGDLRIELPDRAIRLGPGELFVVPKGVEHRPVAIGECEIVLIEPAGTSNTGTADENPDDRPGTEGIWI
jgi:mannose-6-phosphate isomerase-like protein (cupin superfamily)